MENENKTTETVPYAALFNEGPDSILITDQTGRILQANMQAIEVLGHKADELTRMHIADLLSLKNELKIDDILAALNKSRFFSSEGYCARRDRPQFPADLIVMRMTYEDRANLYFFIRNASRRKEAEEKEKNLNKIRGLHMLAGSVAHDFSNMLTSIVGHIELALTTISARSRASEDLATALHDAKRMSDMSRNMLEYSGKGLVEKAPVDLNTVLNTSYDKLVPRIPGHVIMNISESPTPAPVNGEMELLKTAVSNILVNALEAVEKTGGSVSATCTVENIDADMLVSIFTNSALAPGDYACLTVMDTGYGMDDIILSKIFDPFFSTKGSGRGLGLTETQGIVLAHGGTLTVTSQPGSGSTIRLYLPITKASPLKKQTDTLRKKVAASKRVILIVDDDPSVRRYACRIMEKLGFSTLSAEDGETGINLFRLHADEIDIVIVDMFMPRLNGDEVLRAIRRIRGNAKVMIISGYTETIFVDKFKEEQPSGFLYKPFVTSDFVDKITQILNTPGSPI